MSVTEGKYIIAEVIEMAQPNGQIQKISWGAPSFSSK
jgi:hypothetical protein